MEQIELQESIATSTLMRAMVCGADPLLQEGSTVKVSRFDGATLLSIAVIILFLHVAAMIVKHDTSAIYARAFCLVRWN